MSHGNTGHVFLQAIRSIIVSVLKVIAIILGWVCKSIGFIFGKIGEISLNLAEK